MPTATTHLPDFAAFMRQGWAPPAKKHGQKRNLASTRAFYAARRRLLAASFPGEMLILGSGPEKIRANDTHFYYRPGSDFFYLTGCHSPDSILILKPEHQEILFMPQNHGFESDAFFSDHNRGALWVGPEPTFAAYAQQLGIAAVMPLEAAMQTVAEFHGPVRIIRGFAAMAERWVNEKKNPKQRFADDALARRLGEMRLCKELFEIKALQQACTATAHCFAAVVQQLPTARNERQLAATLSSQAQALGFNLGYNSIVAAGKHACILHWSRNNGAIGQHDLVLIDAGLEGSYLYTADITRTLPKSGRFTAIQRAVYRAVLQAHAAALQQIYPGNHFLAPHQAATKVLTEALKQLKVLNVDSQTALNPRYQYYRRYTLHGTSHMLGLDVHDCAAAPSHLYREGRLQEGMVLTVEPGLYFQPQDKLIPAKLRGIGVRLEDDVVVTRKGYRLLSRLPRDDQELENWIHHLWRRPSRRRLHLSK